MWASDCQRASWAGEEGVSGTPAGMVVLRGWSSSAAEGLARRARPTESAGVECATHAVLHSAYQ